MLLKFLVRDAARTLANLASGNPLDLPHAERCNGTWNHDDLAWLAAKVRDVPGDFAAIGVFRGAAFSKIANLAANQGRYAHAFDSFTGMAEPAPAGGTSHAKASFDIDGPDEFVRLMAKAGITRELYEVWPGAVPDCFANVPESLRFAFAMLDVDDYQPAADALRWLPPRISDGGILALDDYSPHAGSMATKSIKEFLATDHGFEKIAAFNQQLILRKRANP